MTKPPAMQFYVRDWMTDPALSLCTPATRGIWIDLLCAMWFATPRGIISGTPETLSRLARCSPAEMRSAILDLDRNGAASVTRNAKVTLRHTKITLTNRRMAKEDKSRRQAKLRAGKYRDKQHSNAEVTAPSAVSAVSASASATNCKTKEREKGGLAPASERILSLSFPHGWTKDQETHTLNALTQAWRVGVPLPFIEAAITGKTITGPPWKRIDDAIERAGRIVKAANDACGGRRFADLQGLGEALRLGKVDRLPKRICGFSLNWILKHCGEPSGTPQQPAESARPG